MIKCLACRCHSAQPIIRRVLRVSHHENWATESIIVGKADCLAELNNFPECRTIGALKRYIQDNSSWAVILGYDGEEIDWAEIGHGGTRGRLEGQMIVERYSDETTKDN